jgi:hypothetical protein
MMHIEWLLNPIAQYVALALTLMGCLALFISTKLEMRAVRRIAQQPVEAPKEIVLSAPVQAPEICEVIPVPEVAPVRVPPGHGINLTKRGQALRMYHRGEPVHSIAAALQAPQNEIELLLKVDQLLNSPNS